MTLPVWLYMIIFLLAVIGWQTVWSWLFEQANKQIDKINKKERG